MKRIIMIWFQTYLKSYIGIKYGNDLDKLSSLTSLVFSSTDTEENLTTRVYLDFGKY